MREPVIALFIEGTYPWYRGGVSEWVHQYIAAFPDYRFIIIQVATDEYRDTELSEALYSVPDQVITFKRVSPPKNVLYRSEQITEWGNEAYKEFADACRNADLLHVANTGFAGLIGMITARRTGKPFILTEHALYWKEVEMGAVALECGYKVPDKEADKERMVQLFRNIAKEIYTAADEVISVSQCNVAEQEKMGAREVRYIPNGVEDRWLQPDRRRNESPVIGWIGRCAEMKNPLKFFDLIEAFQENNEEAKGCRFMMMICDAGEDQLKQEVLDRASNYQGLELIINQPAEKYLPQMDALCITSHNESQPLVLFEALSKKVLPIGWEAGDVTEKYGIIEPQSAESIELAERFWELWNNYDLWNEEVSERFQLVKDNHTWPRIFEQYRKLFKSQIGAEVAYG